MGPIHLLPGSTSSNIQERREYDSKRHAALTLRELVKWTRAAGPLEAAF